MVPIIMNYLLFYVKGESVVDLLYMRVRMQYCGALHTVYYFFVLISWYLVVI
jgi:hypothetical protein